MLRYGIALAVVATALSAANTVASARTPYDGRWSVVIMTDRGPCDQGYRYSLNIVNGNVTYAGDGGFDIRGRVAGGGAVRVRVSHGSQYADGNGRLGQSSGSGVWRGVGSSGVCVGKWTAERRGG